VYAGNMIYRCGKGKAMHYVRYRKPFKHGNTVDDDVFESASLCREVWG
jgi:hypothetical protein